MRTIELQNITAINKGIKGIKMSKIENKNELLASQIKAEIIDLAILKNITGGMPNNGTAQCCAGWVETCGTSHGDWCGQAE